MFANFKRIQKPPGANAFGLIFRAAAAALALWAGGCPALAAEGSPPPALALRDGESLSYGVRWGFIPAVGTITISAEQLGKLGSRDSVLRVTTTTATWGLARGLFPFDARGESVYDGRSGLLVSSGEWSAYRDKVVKNSISFEYSKQRALFVDEIHPANSRTIPMPGGHPSDLILALIQTRSWNLVPGQQRDALVIFQDQFYPLTIHAEGYEYDPERPLGEFKTLVLVPKMEKTAPVGMFKKGSTVKVWIEVDDQRRLPVRFEVGFRFGSGIVTLNDYTPPK